MGARSRKRGRTEQPTAKPAAREPRLSAAERDAAIRAGLEPLAPNEHPPALKVAIGLALLIALANLVLIAVGYDLQDDGKGGVGGAVLFVAVMLVAAWGMWKHRYWAVLGFQTLLMITVIIAAVSLPFASNLAAVALCIPIVGLGGYLFWKLVRVLSRMKTPSAFS